MRGLQIPITDLSVHGHRQERASRTLLRSQHAQRSDDRQGLLNPGRRFQAPVESATFRSPKVVLSFGAGLNSTALLLLWLRDERPLDLVIFSDTGDEMGESFEVAAHAAEVCREAGIEFIVVQDHQQLHERFRDNRAIPLPHRGFRSCTEKLKVAPINREMRRRGWDRHGIIMLIGIAADEAHRMKDGKPAYIEKQWPLVYDYNLGRQGCSDVIEALWSGPPVVKSGCMGCPFIGERGFLELARTDRVAFQRWRKTEEMARDYPKNRLFAEGSTLAEIEHRADTEQSLDVWVRPSIECGVGLCLPDGPRPTEPEELEEK